MSITTKIDNLIEEISIPGTRFLKDIVRGALFGLGAILVGSVLYVIKTLIKLLIKFISHSIFKSQVKRKINNHLLNLISFIDYCDKNNIKRSGIVKFNDISSEIFTCINNSDRNESLVCVVNIIKKLHFYIIDIFVQFVFLVEKDVKIISIFDLDSVEFKNNNLNYVKNTYSTLLSEFFNLINELKQLEKSLVIDVYNVEQEINNKFLEIKSFYIKYR